MWGRDAEAKWYKAGISRLYGKWCVDCATTLDFAAHAIFDAIRDALASSKTNGRTGIAIDVGFAIAYTLAFVIIGTLPGFVSPPPSSKHALMVRVLFMLPLIAYGRVVSHHVPRLAQANASTSVLMIFVSLCGAVLMDTTHRRHYVSSRTSIVPRWSDTAAHHQHVWYHRMARRKPADWRQGRQAYADRCTGEVDHVTHGESNRRL